MSASTDEISNADFSFLPEKSRGKYIKAYELFNNWRLTKGVKNYSESVLLSYFTDISKIRLPSTLWSTYSMLKAVIKRKHDVNIETFQKLLTFLTKKSGGHKITKSKIFTASEIEKFLKEAPDHDYLAIKVVLIIGTHGACRCNELFNISVNDVEKHSDKLILVKLTNSKMKIERSLVISEEYVNFIDKYMSLRPSYAKTTRFFLQYENGKCNVHPMGINRFSEIPRKIAIFLKLQEPHLYTGHCLRRTSFALLGNDDSGADLTNIKRQNYLKSSTDTEGRIEHSTESKSKIRILESIYLTSPTDMSHPTTSEEFFLESLPVTLDPKYPPQYLETEESNMMQENNMLEENFIIESLPVTLDFKYPPQYLETEESNMMQENNMLEENFIIESLPVTLDPKYPPQYIYLETKESNMMQENNMLEENFIIESLPVTLDPKYPPQYIYLETKEPNMIQENNMSEENFIIESLPVTLDPKYPPQYLETEEPNMMQENNILEENFIIESLPVTLDPKYFPLYLETEESNMMQENNMLEDNFITESLPVTLDPKYSPLYLETGESNMMQENNMLEENFIIESLPVTLDPKYPPQYLETEEPNMMQENNMLEENFIIESLPVTLNPKSPSQYLETEEPNMMQENNMLEENFIIESFPVSLDPQQYTDPFPNNDMTISVPDDNFIFDLTNSSPLTFDF